MRRSGKCVCRTKVKLGGRLTRLVRTSFECATISLASITLLNGLLSSRRSLRKSFGMTTLRSQSAHYDLWGRDGRGPRGCNGHPHRCGRILAGRTGAKQTSSRYGEGISRECSTSGRTVRQPGVGVVVSHPDVVSLRVVGGLGGMSKSLTTIRLRPAERPTPMHSCDGQVNFW